MPRGVYVRSAQARANMAAAARLRAKKGTTKAPVVGYGARGRKFRSVKKYNQSVEGQRHAAAAKAGHPLSVKPVATGRKGNVFFNKAKAAAAVKMRNKKLGASASKHGTPLRPGRPRRKK